VTELVRYQAAKAALAVAVSYDEVRDIMDTAERAAVYARQAQDTELIKSATALRVRAQRRAGEMLALTEKATARVVGARREPTRNGAPTLAEMGITKKQSSTWQALASMTSEHFDAAVEAAKDAAGEVTTAFVVREAKKAKPAQETKKRKPNPAKKQSKKDKIRLDELQEAKARGVSMLSTYARLTSTALRSQTDFTPEEREVLDDLLSVLQQVCEKVNNGN
jgi:hypothetical protein